MNIPTTLEWIGSTAGHLSLLDQTLLPGEVKYLDCRTVESVWEAIRVLRVRGAPAIGVAAAYGTVIGARAKIADGIEPLAAVGLAADYLATSRPTAVNLFRALDEMRRAANAASPDRMVAALLDRAVEFHRADEQMCRDIGRHGSELLSDGDGVLTHCNAGALATAGMGTALAVIYEAARAGKRLQVFADETRPLLQGARLTAWELHRAGIDVTLICDNMAASVMASGRIRKVVVGADRIAANGDAANKIGTYGVALCAAAHGIPFYVAAPSTTFDLNLPDGSGIPIEERAETEITEGFGKRTAPVGVRVFNPAFDVTPARLIAGIITERGVIRPVTTAGVRAMLVGPRTSIG